MVEHICGSSTNSELPERVKDREERWNNQISFQLIKNYLKPSDKPEEQNISVFSEME